MMTSIELVIHKLKRYMDHSITLESNYSPRDQHLPGAKTSGYEVVRIAAYEVRSMIKLLEESNIPEPPPPPEPRFGNGGSIYPKGSKEDRKAMKKNDK